MLKIGYYLPVIYLIFLAFAPISVSALLPSISCYSAIRMSMILSRLLGITFCCRDMTVFVVGSPRALVMGSSLSMLVSTELVLELGKIGISRSIISNL